MPGPFEPQDRAHVRALRQYIMFKYLSVSAAVVELHVCLDACCSVPMLRESVTTYLVAKCASDPKSLLMRAQSMQQKLPHWYISSGAACDVWNCTPLLGGVGPVAMRKVAPVQGNSAQRMQQAETALNRGKAKQLKARFRREIICTVLLPWKWKKNRFHAMLVRL